MEWKKTSCNYMKIFDYTKGSKVQLDTEVFILNTPHLSQQYQAQQWQTLFWRYSSWYFRFSHFLESNTSY